MKQENEEICEEAKCFKKSSHFKSMIFFSYICNTIINNPLLNYPSFKKVLELNPVSLESLPNNPWSRINFLIREKLGYHVFMSQWLDNCMDNFETKVEPN